MPREISSNYPVMVQAFQSPVREEGVETIEGCHREACGAWGIGVCKVTVSLPESSNETLADTISQTSLLKVGCISCSDLDSSFSGGGVNTEPAKPMNIDANNDPEDFLFDAGNIHLPAAFKKMRNQTQEQVNNIYQI